MSKYNGHTPGPWKVREQDDDFLVVMDDDDAMSWCEVCQVAEQREQEANARLIADAPTILSQRDEAVALLRRLTMSGSTAMVSVFLKDDIDAFLSRLDSKEPCDASD